MTFSPLLLGLLLGSFILSFFSWGKRLLFPFQLFTTWVHECSHALVALMLGGNDIRILLTPDGSGVTHYKIPEGRFRRAIIASSGYLGASAFGCELFFGVHLAQRTHAGLGIHALSLSLVALVSTSLLFWIRNVFGFIATASLAVAIAGLEHFASTAHLKTALLFLAFQTALQALFDLRNLLGISAKSESDAHTLQKLFLLPHWFWTFCWLGLSLLLMHWTYRQV